MKQLVMIALVAASMATAGSVATAGTDTNTGVLLLKVSVPSTTVTSFGSGASASDPGVDTMRKHIAELGFAVVPPPADRVAVAGDAAGLVPVGDRAAAELARTSGAGSAWVVGIEVRDGGRIRGTALRGAVARGQMRVLDARSGQLVAEATISEASSYDADLDRAAARAAAQVASKLVETVHRDVARHWPRSEAGWSGISVGIRGARTWNAISSIIQRIGQTDGVRAVHARDVERTVMLTLETDRSAAAIASSIERTRLARGSARARASGSKVVVDVHGDAPFGDSASELDEAD